MLVQQSVLRSVYIFGNVSEFPATPNEIAAHAPPAPSRAIRRYEGPSCTTSRRQRPRAARRVLHPNHLCSRARLDTPFEESATRDEKLVQSKRAAVAPPIPSRRRGIYSTRRRLLER